MSPTIQTFVTHEVASNPLGWRIEDDYRVRALWLPLVGPSSFLLLRHLNDTHDVASAHGYGVRVPHDAADVADALGVHPKRVGESLLRLRRFGLISEDEFETTLEVPVFICSRTVPPITTRQWARLPAGVRERMASTVLE